MRGEGEESLLYTPMYGSCTVKPGQIGQNGPEVSSCISVSDAYHHYKIKYPGESHGKFANSPRKMGFFRLVEGKFTIFIGFLEGPGPLGPPLDPRMKVLLLKIEEPRIK